MLGRYQVLQIPDRKAFNMLSEAELCVRIAKKRQELPSLLLEWTVFHKKTFIIEQHPKPEKNFPLCKVLGKCQLVLHLYLKKKAF